MPRGRSYSRLGRFRRTALIHPGNVGCRSLNRTGRNWRRPRFESSSRRQTLDAARITGRRKTARSRAQCGDALAKLRMTSDRCAARPAGGVPSAVRRQAKERPGRRSRNPRALELVLASCVCRNATALEGTSVVQRPRVARLPARPPTCTPRRSCGLGAQIKIRWRGGRPVVRVGDLRRFEPSVSALAPRPRPVRISRAARRPCLWACGCRHNLGPGCRCTTNSGVAMRIHPVRRISGDLAIPPHAPGAPHASLLTQNGWR